MDKKEVASLLKFLSGSFPNQLDFPSGSSEKDKNLIRTWLEWLGQYKLGAVKEAVKEAAMDNPDFVPSPPKIESAIMDSKTLSPDEAWELAHSACLEYHPQINPNPDISHLPPEVKRTIEVVGGVHKLGSLEVDDSYTRNNFIKKYKEIRKNRQVRERQLGLSRNEDYSVMELLEEISSGDSDKVENELPSSQDKINGEKNNGNGNKI